jgi:hypothetical protein
LEKYLTLQNDAKDDFHNMVVITKQWKIFYDFWLEQRLLVFFDLTFKFKIVFEYVIKRY